MTLLRKLTYFGLFPLSLILIGVYALYLQPRLPIINGLSAKARCSCHQYAGLSLDQIQQEDLSFSVVGQTNGQWHAKQQSATSSFFGLGHAEAKAKGSFGCVLIHGEDNFKGQLPKLDWSIGQNDSLTWPYGSLEAPIGTKDLKPRDLENAGSQFFLPPYETRGLLVVLRDTIIYEKYSDGLTENTPQLGWSMTKSVMNTLIGRALQLGLIDLQKTPLFSNWQYDDRKNIRLQHLLQMNSGLEWEEDYTTISDATRMLYMSEDIVALAKSKSLEHPIGTFWEYSSGTSNLLSGYLRQTLDSDQNYWAFPFRELFIPLQMKTAFIEPDEAGNFIGSSYMYASARDWAKFGLLYLHDGIWNGQRLLPDGWVDFSRQVASGSKGKYGAQFWLNEGGEYPSLPKDLYFADGFQGQRVFIFPSQDMVVVRLGTGGELPLDQLMADLLKEISQ